MKSLVFRVRKQYFDAIVAGTKKVEHRKDSPFWRKRLGPIADKKFPSQQEPMIAVFLCGKIVHRRKVTYVEKILTPSWFSEQGRKDVPTERCYAVYLGAEIKPLRKIIRELLEWNLPNFPIPRQEESIERYVDAFLEGRLKIHYDPKHEVLFFELTLKNTGII